MTTRLSININDETAQALRELADESGTTVTEVVRRAVSVYKFFDDARDEGKTIQLVSPNEEKVTQIQLV
ncbi:MAG: ribbon-helix-helix protein, CopG family [Nocardioidaceae bacterium]